MSTVAATVLVAQTSRHPDPERTAELLGLARRAAEPQHARVALVEGGVDTPDVRTCALALLDACAEAHPSLVLFGDDGFDRAVAAWLAQRIGGGVVTGAVELWWDGSTATVTRGVLSGAGLQTCRVSGGILPVVCLARGAAVQSAPTPSNGAESTPLTLQAHAPDAEPHVTVVAERTTRQRLRGARIVVSGGAGVGGAEGFAKVRELAGRLGGATGAARGAIVNGWAEGAEKVGLTGATVAPDLYLAAGISGASQHMAGCRRARVIVAINRDRGAPIFRHATYGLVADSTAVLDALLAQVQAAAAVQDRTPEDAPT